MRDAVTLNVHPPETSPDGGFVSVIIPLAEHEAVPEALLTSLSKSFEIILARGGTRASSMNQAASVAIGRHLWFVHADTTLSAEAVPMLLEQLHEQPGALRYFDLRFDGGTLMRLTEGGVSFRSRVFGLPFGDQALCLPAAMFTSLGGYDETAAHGEDHQLVRDARRAGFPIQPVGATITTSARKYREKGWFRTTFMHLRLTLLQSLRAP